MASRALTTDGSVTKYGCRIPHIAFSLTGNTADVVIDLYDTAGTDPSGLSKVWSIVLDDATYNAPIYVDVHALVFKNGCYMDQTGLSAGSLTATFQIQ